MGLPVKQFIAANNSNDVVYEYLETGKYEPRKSVETIANAMDVGAPSNFARILDLFDHSHATISKRIKGYRYSDEEIREIINKVYQNLGYLCDPHGACGYQALVEYLCDKQVGVFLETAHPAKFTETVEAVIGQGKVDLPEKLAVFMKGTKETKPINSSYDEFRKYLIDHPLFV